MRPWAGIRSSGKPIKIVEYAQGWQVSKLCLEIDLANG
jgi:hypothetical protein